MMQSIRDAINHSRRLDDDEERCLGNALNNNRFPDGKPVKLDAFDMRRLAVYRRAVQVGLYEDWAGEEHTHTTVMALHIDGPPQGRMILGGTCWRYPQ